MLWLCAAIRDTAARKDARHWRARCHADRGDTKRRRSNWPVVAYAPPAVALNSSSSAGFQPILMSIMAAFSRRKAASSSLTKTSIRGYAHIWRLFAWTASTGGECWFLLYHSPVHSFWINLACLIVLAVINWLIVAKPVEVYRRIEIRSDCMILEDAISSGVAIWKAAGPPLSPTRRATSFCAASMARASSNI